MHTSAALALALVLAAPGPLATPASATPQHGNLLRGPARLVLRYLDAVRLVEVRAERTRRAKELEDVLARANRHVAARALEEAEKHVARGADHPLAFWKDTDGRALHGFQLLAVRRAPRSSVVVTVEESHRDDRSDDGRLARTVSEYLVARVEGEWKVVDRKAGARFDDAVIVSSYDGWWDEPISLAR
jgi:hypothetical protein